MDDRAKTESVIGMGQNMQLEIFRVVPSLSRLCCHRSPRYGMLPP